MVSSDIASLLRRLAEAHEATPNAVIASDGDGTVWRGDIGEALFAAALADGVLSDAACEPLRQEARRHALSADGNSHDLARRLLHAYEEGRYPEEPAFAMMAWAFVGWSIVRLHDYCDTVLDRFAFGDAVRPQMLRVFAWAQRQQVPLWLVSASQQQLVERAALRLGLPAGRVVAMAPNIHNGVLCAGLAKPATYALGKVTRLRAVEPRPLLAAFGDSAFDAALLEQARLPVAVCPSAELRHRIERIPNGLVLNLDP